MNCAECRDNLVAWAEGCLAPEDSRQCQAHLEHCAGCSAEFAVIQRLQQELTASGRLGTQVSVVDSVMRRVRQEPRKHERSSVMSRIVTRWGFGLGAAAGATAVVILLLLAVPRTQGRASEIMARSARAMAKLSSVHLKGLLRTTPGDNFSAIMPDQPFTTVELWKQFTPLKWRAEKTGRIAVMDGQSSVLFIKPDFALKGPASSSAFDTQWLHQMADLSETLTWELSAIKAHGWPVTLSQGSGPDGKAKSTITVEAQSGLSDGDYLQNKFFTTANTRRVYVFDDESELLESVKVYLVGAPDDGLIFDLSRIDYNQAIDPGVFQLQLPANVSWEQPMQVLPDNQKYASMTPEQAARTFLEACSREDWVEAGKFQTITESFKQDRGGLQLISIGKSFTSALSLISGARFVPYEVKYKDGNVVKWNLSLKKDEATGRWYVDGGI